MWSANRNRARSTRPRWDETSLHLIHYDIALQGALLNAGYSTDRLDLATGLEDAIANPDAEARWLAGGLVFPSALRIEQQAYLEDPISLAPYRAAFS